MSTETGSAGYDGRSPERFKVSRSVRVIDRTMSVVIRTGGVGIIVAVLGIFLFILVQIIPLFFGASVELKGVHQLPTDTPRALMVDEWSELPAVVDGDGVLHFMDLTGKGLDESIDLREKVGAEITAVRLRELQGTIVVGTAEGGFTTIDVTYRPEFDGETRRIAQRTAVGKTFMIAEGARVVSIDWGDSDRDKVAAAVVEKDGERRVHAGMLSQRRTLVGAGEITLNRVIDLTPELHATPRQVLATTTGDSLLVVTDGGEIDYFFKVGDGFELRQRFHPFADLLESGGNAEISRAEFLLGDESLVVVSEDGANRIFSLFSPEEGAPRSWGQTMAFPDLDGPATGFAKSLRNKGFALAADRFLSIRYRTTESIRWESAVEFQPKLIQLSGKYDRLFVIDDASVMHEYVLDDPHPEASWRAFFGRIWYEGYDAPRFEWQSTGGTDDFEIKLSMIPLIIGSLKGTFYALLFAVPIALTAALYTSQFAHWKVRAVVKPLMEVMASLPSVVLGFLAALWLAPILETRVPTVLTGMILIPLSALAIGMVFHKVPLAVRNRMGLFGELVILFAVLGVVCVASGFLGPIVESILFRTTDPTTGQVVADFRYWWVEWTGADFQQRNSLVVGFMMGFAVIPIIFTITEDSLSNVPQNLRSGSLALGATRWQTAINVVLPTASAGIFSALMIGLGRAVGETMIVLMATGNTPIMDFNIFSGMRTLSANIAVELPEAPHHGTLFRALFLGAMLLFLMTFAVNTVAELLRQYLRDRYKTV